MKTQAAVAALAWLCTWPFATSATATAMVTIELRPELRAGDSPVRLGQLARIASPDLPLVRRLVDLPVGRPPLPGDTVVLERTTLATWLRRVGLDADQVAWMGAPATQVVSAVRTVSGEQIAGAATRGLHDWLAARGIQADLELVSTPRDLLAAEGELQLRMRDPGEVRLRRRITVWVEAWVGSRFARVVPVTFVLSDGGVASAAQPIVALHGSRRISPQSSLAMEGDARPAPTDAALAVQRGEWASLHSGAGVVRTEARVQVLQDGKLGDKVRVKPSSAGPSFLARVTGAGQLEVAP